MAKTCCDSFFINYCKYIIRTERLFYFRFFRSCECIVRTNIARMMPSNRIKSIDQSIDVWCFIDLTVTISLIRRWGKYWRRRMKDHRIWRGRITFRCINWRRFWFTLNIVLSVRFSRHNIFGSIIRSRCQLFIICIVFFKFHFLVRTRKKRKFIHLHIESHSQPNDRTLCSIYLLKHFKYILLPLANILSGFISLTLVGFTR